MMVNIICIKKFINLSQKVFESLSVSLYKNFVRFISFPELTQRDSDFVCMRSSEVHGPYSLIMYYKFKVET